MTNIEDQIRETELAAKYPWQRTVLVLVAAIGLLFSGLQYYQSEGRKEASAREKELASSQAIIILALEKKLVKVTAEKDSCNEGKVSIISDMLNRELALKLSRDTTFTARKIVESLIRVSETKNKIK